VSPRARRIARIALLVGTILAVLVATEALLRRADLPHFDACSATADFAIPDAELGFVGAPGAIVAGESLNALGLRGPMLATTKPVETIRMLFLGDSTCWGLGVPLEAGLAARAAQLVAKDHPDHAVEYLIGAFPGYSSYQSKIQLRRLLPMQPDLVVFYVGARNDSTRHRYFRDAEIPARRARVDAGWHRVRLLRLGEALGDRVYKSALRKVLSYDARARVPLGAFRANISEMLEQIERAGVAGLIVVPPVSGRLLEREPSASGYREALIETAKSHGVPIVPLQEIFDRAGAEQMYFEDGYHFSVRGHEHAARAIARAIEAYDLVRSPRGR
jgi:lysophospholipase L1-like esterase